MFPSRLTEFVSLCFSRLFLDTEGEEQFVSSRFVFTPLFRRGSLVSRSPPLPSPFAGCISQTLKSFLGNWIESTHPACYFSSCPLLHLLVVRPSCPLVVPLPSFLPFLSSSSSLGHVPPGNLLRSFGVVSFPFNRRGIATFAPTKPSPPSPLDCLRPLSGNLYVNRDESVESHAYVYGVRGCCCLRSKAIDSRFFVERFGQGSRSV